MMLDMWIDVNDVDGVDGVDGVDAYLRIRRMVRGSRKTRHGRPKWRQGEDTDTTATSLEIRDDCLRLSDSPTLRL